MNKQKILLKEKKILGILKRGVGIFVKSVVSISGKVIKFLFWKSGNFLKLVGQELGKLPLLFLIHLLFQLAYIKGEMGTIERGELRQMRKKHLLVLGIMVFGAYFTLEYIMFEEFIPNFKNHLEYEQLRLDYGVRFLGFYLGLFVLYNIYYFITALFPKYQVLDPRLGYGGFTFVCITHWSRYPEGNKLRPEIAAKLDPIKEGEGRFGRCHQIELEPGIEVVEFLGVEHGILYVLFQWGYGANGFGDEWYEAGGDAPWPEEEALDISYDGTGIKAGVIPEMPPEVYKDPEPLSKSEIRTVLETSSIVYNNTDFESDILKKFEEGLQSLDPAILSTETKIYLLEFNLSTKPFNPPKTVAKELIERLLASRLSNTSSVDLLTFKQLLYGNKKLNKYYNGRVNDIPEDERACLRGPDPLFDVKGARAVPIKETFKVDSVKESLDERMMREQMGKVKEHFKSSCFTYVSNICKELDTRSYQMLEHLLDPTFDFKTAYVHSMSMYRFSKFNRLLMPLYYEEKYYHLLLEEGRKVYPELVDSSDVNNVWVLLYEEEENYLESLDNSAVEINLISGVPIVAIELMYYEYIQKQRDESGFNILNLFTKVKQVYARIKGLVNIVSVYLSLGLVAVGTLYTRFYCFLKVRFYSKHFTYNLGDFSYFHRQASKGRLNRISRGYKKYGVLRYLLFIYPFETFKMWYNLNGKHRKEQSRAPQNDAVWALYFMKERRSRETLRLAFARYNQIKHVGRPPMLVSFSIKINRLIGFIGRKYFNRKGVFFKGYKKIDISPSSISICFGDKFDDSIEYHYYRKYDPVELTVTEASTDAQKMRFIEIIDQIYEKREAVLNLGKSRALNKEQVLRKRAFERYRDRWNEDYMDDYVETQYHNILYEFTAKYGNYNKFQTVTYGEVSKHKHYVETPGSIHYGGDPVGVLQEDAEIEAMGGVMPDYEGEDVKIDDDEELRYNERFKDEFKDDKS